MLNNRSRPVVGLKVIWHLHVYIEIKETFYWIIKFWVFLPSLLNRRKRRSSLWRPPQGGEHSSPLHASHSISLRLLSVIHHPGYLRQTDSLNVCSCRGKRIMLYSTIQKNSGKYSLNSAMRYLPNLTTDNYIYKLSINISKSRGGASETKTTLWTDARWKKQPQWRLLIQLWTSAITLLLGFTEAESGRQMELVSFQSGGTEQCMSSPKASRHWLQCFHDLRRKNVNKKTHSFSCTKSESNKCTIL